MLQQIPTLFLFSKLLLVRTRSIIFYDPLYLKQKKTRTKMEVVHTKTVINKRLLITCVCVFVYIFPSPKELYLNTL